MRNPWKELGVKEGKIIALREANSKLMDERNKLWAENVRLRAYLSRIQAQIHEWNPPRTIQVYDRGDS